MDFCTLHSKVHHLKSTRTPLSVCLQQPCETNKLLKKLYLHLLQKFLQIALSMKERLLAGVAKSCLFFLFLLFVASRRITTWLQLL